MINDKQDSLMMNMAILVSKESNDVKTQVGAVITSGHQILGYGYNGTPYGFDNECRDSDGKTLDIVIHAEMNAIAKVAKSNNSTEGATIYTTLSPCTHCAVMLVQSGIKEVVYANKFKYGFHGIMVLKEAGIKVRSM